MPPARGRAGESVDSFLERLEHPRKPAILALRQVVRAADARIGEELKWNAPSFFTAEHFATFNLRARDGVQLVLHRGAKPRETPGRLPVDDPSGLLEWKANDRAIATFRDEDEVAARSAALTAIIRAWIEHV
jgi:hypothetical protein